MGVPVVLKRTVTILAFELARQISDGEFDSDLERFLTHENEMIRKSAFKRWEFCSKYPNKE